MIGAPGLLAALTLVATSALVPVAGAAHAGVAAPARRALATARAARPRAASGVLLALGDSLAAGYQPTDGSSPPPRDPATGEPDRGYPGGYAEDLASGLGLDLVDLACPGETTRSMTSTPARPACAAVYRAELGAASQLQAAEVYLERHRGEVRLVTLDIGANDVLACVSQAAVDFACLARAEASVPAVAGRIAGVLAKALSADDPGARLVAMNYYDPLLALAYRPGGARGTTDAALSLALFEAFDRLLTAAYGREHVLVANVSAAFQTGRVAPPLRYSGRLLPRDVAVVCRLTWMCPPPGSTRAPDIHPDDAGYRAIAGAFSEVLGGG